MPREIFVLALETIVDEGNDLHEPINQDHVFQKIHFNPDEWPGCMDVIIHSIANGLIANLPTFNAGKKDIIEISGLDKNVPTDIWYRFQMEFNNLISVASDAFADMSAFSGVRLEPKYNRKRGVMTISAVGPRMARIKTPFEEFVAKRGAHTSMGENFENSDKIKIALLITTVIMAVFNSCQMIINNASVETHDASGQERDKD